MKKVNLSLIVILAFSLILNVFLAFTVWSNGEYQRSQIEGLKQLYSIPELNPDKLTSVVNEWRVKEGLKPYTENAGLCDIAEQRALELYNKTYSDHHEGLISRYIESNNPYPSLLAENIALHENQSEENHFNYYTASKGHRENLLDDYKYSCVKTKGFHSVQIFSNCENGCPEL